MHEQASALAADMIQTVSVIAGDTKNFIITTNPRLSS